MQKNVNHVDLVKNFPTNIFSQILASIQRRTSPMKLAHLAEKSDKGSISNLSTKGPTGPRRAAHGGRHPNARSCEESRYLFPGDREGEKGFRQVR